MLARIGRENDEVREDASGREVITALRIAGAAGDVDTVRVAREVDAVDCIVATLYKLAYRARRARARPAVSLHQTGPRQFPRRGTVAAARAACFCWHSEQVPYISCLCVFSTKP